MRQAVRDPYSKGRSVGKSVNSLVFTRRIEVRSMLIPHNDNRGAWRGDVNVNHQVLRGIRESLWNLNAFAIFEEPSKGHLRRWQMHSRAIEETSSHKLKIESGAGIVGPRHMSGRSGHPGGSRNAPIKRIILVIVVRNILVGFDAFFFNFIK